MLPTGHIIDRLHRLAVGRVTVADASNSAVLMTRPRLRTSGPTAVNPERKAIEQRAREAAKPAAAEKKGRWPFTADASNGSSAPDPGNRESGQRSDDNR